jgi:protein-disulfide isomerase
MKKNILPPSVMTRRSFASGTLATTAMMLTGSGVVAADEMLDRALSPRIIGDESAPIHVAEYYSMTCGHCADFHNNTYPKVKAKLIDKGIVRFEMRPFPLDGLALRAHALVRAIPESKFFPLVKLLLAKQPVWTRAADPVAELQQMARLAGVGSEDFNSIMRNRPLLEGLVNLRQQGMDDWKVNSTPTFVVNDDMTMAGNMAYEEFAEAISAFGA